MYIVSIQNGDTVTQIHNSDNKLSNGKVTKGINTIDSFNSQCYRLTLDLMKSMIIQPL